MLRRRNWSGYRTVVVSSVILGLLVELFPMPVFGAGFTSAYVRLDRMSVSTTTGGLVCVKPTAAGTESQLLVTFPSTYTVDSTAANWIMTDTDIPAGSTSMPAAVAGTTTATSATSPANVVTFPTGGDLTPGTLYCFDFAAASTLTTATVAANDQQGKLESQTAGSARIDYTEFALANIADDQIVVTAVVPPSFQFSLTSNADSMLLATGSVVASSGVTGSVTTNAKGGWIAWARDTDRGGGSQGLRSATAGYTLPTSGTVDAAVSTIVAGVEGYVLDVDTSDAANGCAAATTAEYDGTAAAEGGTFSSIFQPISQCTGVDGTGRGSANGDTFVLVEKATIAGMTPAATDYSDVITVVAAGNF